MDTVDKLKYLLKDGTDNCAAFGLVAIVPESEVTGKKQSNDSDSDYFDHKYIDQSCWEDMCHGHEFVPVCDGSGQYFKFEYHC